MSVRAKSPLDFAERDDRDAKLDDEAGEVVVGRRLPAPRRDHASLDERGRPHADVIGLENPIDEIEIARLGEEDRHEHGGVERHTPPGP
jgi:hypothetical protein